MNITHPNSIPYGLLRNDYMYDLKVENMVYKTPLNYIYSNLLPEGDIRRIALREAKAKDIEITYNMVISNIERDALYGALKTVIETKLKSNRWFKTLLFETGNNRILYLSRNITLGVGYENQGMNAYGQWLEQIRDIYRPRSSKTATLSEDEIYDYYLAEKGLIMALHYENLDSYFHINNFVDLIKELIKKYGKDKVLIVDKKTALALHGKRNVKIQPHPSNLIRYIRKIKIRETRNENLESQRQGIFNLYVDHLMNHNDTFKYAPNKDLVKLNEFSLISPHEKSLLIQRTFNLYNRGLLPIEFKNNLYMPSDSTINQYEADTVPIPIQMDHQEDEPLVRSTKSIWIYPNRRDKEISLDGKLLNHTKYDGLSLLDDFMMTIDGYKYPTMSHYLMVKRVQLIPNYNNIKNAYLCINNGNKFFNIEDSERRVAEAESSLPLTKYKLLDHILDIKFSQPLFKTVLISTNNREINFGKQEFDHRTIDKLNNLRTIIYPPLTTINKWYTDAYIQKYISSKLNDILYTLKAFQLFCKYKGKPYILTKDYIRVFLDNFYGQCSFTKFGSNDILDYLSEWHNHGFQVKQTKPTFRIMSLESSQMIFDIVINHLSGLKNLLNLNENYVIFYNIGLINTQWLMNTLSKQIPLFEVRNLPNPKIISAIINIIRLCNKNRKTEVDEIDVKTAISILTRKLQPLGTLRDQLLDDIVDDGIEFGSEPEPDVEPGYEEPENFPTTINNHFVDLKLRIVDGLDQLIIDAAKKIKKVKGIDTRINYYA